MTAAEARGAWERARLPLRDRLLIEELYRYCVFRENGKVFFGFPAETIKTILVHRASKGRLIFHRDRDGDIDGFFAWYRFGKDWDWASIKNWDEDKEDGEEIFLAYLFADSSGALADMVLEFIEKEPDCLHLTLRGVRQRGTKRTPTRVTYTQQLLSRLIKHGRKK